MSRSLARRVERHVGVVLLIGLSIVACSDAYTGPAPYAPDSNATYEPELTLFVGDTVDVSSIISLAEGDEGSCVSTDASVAAVNGTVEIVGQAVGDVALLCTRVVYDDAIIRARTDEPTDRAFYHYSVQVHVREHDAAPELPAEPAVETLPKPASIVLPAAAVRHGRR